MERYVLQVIDDSAQLHHVGFYDTVESARLHVQAILKVIPGSDLKLFFGPEGADWDDEGITTLALE